MENNVETFNDPLNKDSKGQDELDFIFGEQVQKDTPKVILNSAPTTPIPSKEESKKEELEGLRESCVPSLRGEGFDDEYIKLVNRIKAQYSLLPKLNYDDIDKELGELNIKSNPTPNLQMLNDELQKVQAAKDRLSEIFIDVIRSYNFKERAVDILTDAWGKFTLEKNADGRKGDAQYRLSNFAIDLANIQGLLKTCMHILKNLDSAQENLSKRISVYQMILKIDLSKTFMPDYDFERKPLSPLADDKTPPLNESGELSMENF